MKSQGFSTFDEAFKMMRLTLDIDSKNLKQIESGRVEKVGKNSKKE